MQKGWLIPIGLAVVIIILTGLIFFLPVRVPEIPAPPAAPPPAPAVSGIPDLLVVETPAPNDVVVSPLTITGRARGNWYFEASFPIRIKDANGAELGVRPAEAQGDWMTTDFVLFRATLTFRSSPTDIGTLVFEKDNPSGLPEFDRKYEMPIRFR